MSLESTIHKMIMDVVRPVAEALDNNVEVKAKAAIEEALKDFEIPNQKLEIILKDFDGIERKIDNAHPATPMIIAALQEPNPNDRNVYVWGPAGTAKTTTAMKVAEAMGLPIHIQGTAMSKYDLLGFRLPSGEVVRTAFMEAWENGGVFILDDGDRSDPKALSALNACTANGVCDFSHCGMGLIKRHPDCYIIMTGNTNMLGASAGMVAASQQDAAFRDRFAFVEMKLCEDFELSITPNSDWTKRVQNIRATVTKLDKRAQESVLCSMRASFRGASLFEAGLTQRQVEEMVVFKGVGEDLTNLVYANAGEPSDLPNEINIK